MKKNQVISGYIEPTELEKISNYMTEIEYVFNTKDVGTIHCILHKKNSMWSGKVIWVTKPITYNDVHLYDTQEQHGIERCINLMNEFIKNNFKTELDKF